MKTQVAEIEIKLIPAQPGSTSFWTILAYSADHQIARVLQFGCGQDKAKAIAQELASFAQSQPDIASIKRKAISLIAN